MGIGTETHPFWTGDTSKLLLNADKSTKMRNEATKEAIRAMVET